MKRALSLLALLPALAFAQGYQPTPAGGSGGGGGSSGGITLSGTAAANRVSLCADTSCNLKTSANLSYTTTGHLLVGVTSDDAASTIQITGDISLSDSGKIYFDKAHNRYIDFGSGAFEVTNLGGISANGDGSFYGAVTASHGDIIAMGTDGTNVLHMTGSATGVATAITATGGNTNIGINLVPKGTGVVAITGGGATLTTTVNTGEAIFLKSAPYSDVAMSSDDGSNIALFDWTTAYNGSPSPRAGILLGGRIGATSGDLGYFTSLTAQKENTTLNNNASSFSISTHSTGSATVTAAKWDSSQNLVNTGTVTAPGFHCTDATRCGTKTLSGGTGTVTVATGCVAICTDSTAANAVGCSVSGTSLTVTGTGTDVIKWLCF